jgi:hypothetical protein
MKGNPMNQFAVGAVGKKITINNLAPRPSLSAREALELAAWLVAPAIPVAGGDASTELGKFLRLVVDAAGDGELSEAVERELEE